MYNALMDPKLQAEIDAEKAKLADEPKSSTITRDVVALPSRQSIPINLVYVGLAIIIILTVLPTRGLTIPLLLILGLEVNYRTSGSSKMGRLLSVFLFIIFLIIVMSIIMVVGLFTLGCGMNCVESVYEGQRIGWAIATIIALVPLVAGLYFNRKR